MADRCIGQKADSLGGPHEQVCRSPSELLLDLSLSAVARIATGIVLRELGQLDSWALVWKAGHGLRFAESGTGSRRALWHVQVGGQ